MIPRHIETLFCDDIRHEVGGKLSFVGVYSGGLLVSDFPVTLPKLCLSLKVITPIDEPLRSLCLRVFKDQEIMQEITLDEEKLVAPSEPLEKLSEEQRQERIYTTQLMLVFSPIQFDGPCTLRVRAQTEDGELRGVGLRVEKTPSLAEDPVDEKKE